LPYADDTGVRSRLLLESWPGEEAAKKMVLDLVIDLWTHEVKEWLTYKGQLIENPHP
jgi:hypothetical protein